MPALPSWYPDPEETKPAPAPLLRVQAFLNTRDLDGHTDVLDDPNAAGAWLAAAGLLSAGSALEPGDLNLARAVRESIRSLLDPERADSSGEAALRPVRELAASHRPRLTVDDHGRFALDPERRGRLADGLFELLMIIQRAQEDGTWPRLKVCANPDCRWAFYDRSRNRHGSWCEMAVCGNRLKNRNLRARRR